MGAGQRCALREPPNIAAYASPPPPRCPGTAGSAAFFPRYFLSHGIGFLMGAVVAVVAVVAVAMRCIVPSVTHRLLQVAAQGVGSRGNEGAMRCVFGTISREG